MTCPKPERVCPCGGPMPPYSSMCRPCEAQTPHCENCGDLLRVPHWTAPTGRCTTVAPAVVETPKESAKGQMPMNLEDP